MEDFPMKKFNNLIFGLLTSFCLLFVFNSCGSVDETVTSEVSANHITVQQIKSGVKIILTKTAEEDITHIEVVESEYGTYASVPMGTNLKQSFIWPFSDQDKEYTLVAKLYGVDSYSEETISFKVENPATSVVSYTEDYLESKLILIASGNKRFIQFETDKNKLMSVFNKVSPKNAEITIELFSGKKIDNANSQKKPVATLKYPVENKDDFQKVIEGYDIISNASNFGLTPAQLNATLSSSPKYYAKAYITFSLDGTYPEGFILSTSPLYSNDTVYTPIPTSELPN